MGLKKLFKKAVSFGRDNGFLPNDVQEALRWGLDPVSHATGLGGDYSIAGLAPNLEEWRRDFYNPIRGYTNYLLRQMPEIPAPDDYRRMSTDQSAPRRLIYGTARVGGQMVFLRTSGANSQFLHIVIVVADHQVAAIGDVYLGERLSTDARFAGKVTIVKHLGGGTAQPFPTLQALNIGWTSNHLLVGCSAIYVKFTYSRDAYPNGIPRVNAIVQGKNDIYDPRTETSGHSDNWALVAYDYMRFARGMNATAAEIDTASVITAADICDELVPADSGTATEKRYTVNGVVDLAGTPLDALKGLSVHAAGRIFYSGGEWKVVAGSYIAPSVTLTESDLAGGLSFTSGAGKSERINTMYGTFVDAPNGYIATDLPVVRSAAYLLEDLEELRGDVFLPMCTSGGQAQRIQKITIEKSRRGLVCTFPAKHTTTKLAPLDRVAVTIAALGWSSKVFLVDDYDFSVRGGVGLRLVEDDATLYGWTAGEVAAVVRNQLTGLPDPYTAVPPTALVLESGPSHLLTLDDGTVVARILASWSTAADTFVDRYEVEYRLASETDWTQLAAVSGLRAYCAPVVGGGAYIVRVRSINDIGVRSTWVSANHTAVADTVAPPNPTSLSSTPEPLAIRLNWGFPVGVSTLKYVEVWTGPSTTPTTQVATVSADSWVHGNLSPSQQVRYWIRPVSTSRVAGDFYPTAGLLATAGIFTADKISSGTITSKIIALAVTPGGGDSCFRAGKSDFGDTTNGFILGIDDSDADKAKFEIGNASKYISWNGTDLIINGATVSGGSLADSVAPVTSGYGHHMVYIGSGAYPILSGWTSTNYTTYGPMCYMNANGRVDISVEVSSGSASGVTTFDIMKNGLVIYTGSHTGNTIGGHSMEVDILKGDRFSCRIKTNNSAYGAILRSIKIMTQGVCFPCASAQYVPIW